MHAPDYDLAATLPVAGAEVHSALADPRRRRILGLLLERAATAKQLAAVIERSPQATTHHLEVLADAGLVRVVRTDRVRATTRRWWGRTARLFLVDGGGDESPDGLLREAQAEMAAGRAVDRGTTKGTIRYARVPADRAEEWFSRVADLVDEFAAQPRDGDVVHGVVVQVFPTSWGPLPHDDEGPS